MNREGLWNKMIVTGRLKRTLQALSLTTIAMYSTLLVYQTITRIDIQGTSEWQPESQDLITENTLIDTSTSTDDENSNLQTNPVLMTYTTVPVAPTISYSEGLDWVFISVKTTRNYHASRLRTILKTWFQLAKKQTWFFTDTEDTIYQNLTGGHMVNTNCSSSHSRRALCCKMAVEFDAFLDSGKKWFCHFDDDNYVNVPRLVQVLSTYSPQQDWYLGKPSIRAPLEIMHREDSKRKASFWFATGGAGFCISKALALKMVPLASDGKFISIGENIRLPDDVTMGYIIEHLLGKSLTVMEQFHSHLEPMKFLRTDALKDQISISYSSSKEEWNIVNIDGFDLKYDSNRFLSIHCLLFPNFSFCPR